MGPYEEAGNGDNTLPSPILRTLKRLYTNRRVDSRQLVRVVGFEPTATTLKMSCSTRLSYTPPCVFIVAQPVCARNPRLLCLANPPARAGRPPSIVPRPSPSFASFRPHLPIPLCSIHSRRLPSVVLRALAVLCGEPPRRLAVAVLICTICGRPSSSSVHSAVTGQSSGGRTVSILCGTGALARGCHNRTFPQPRAAVPRLRKTDRLHSAIPSFAPHTPQ